MDKIKIKFLLKAHHSDMELDGRVECYVQYFPLDIFNRII